MNESPTITISFRIEEDRSVRIIESQLPYTGKFDNLKEIVSEAQLMFYRLGWAGESVEKAIEETKNKAIVF